MKRLCLLTAAMLLLCGCADTVSKPDSAAETTLTDTNEQRSAAQSDDGWREAYAAVLRGTVAKRFSLVYIDDDDIPEMTLHFTDEGLASNADAPILYIYNNGQAENMGNFSQEGMDQFCYVERNGIVINSNTVTGAGYQDFLRLENGALNRESRIEIDSSGMTSADVVYILNGENCTKADYDALQEQYSVKESRVTCGDYVINEGNILKYVLTE